MNNKLQAKDLINIGIFTTIYFVIYFATMMLGYIPILDVLLGLICPITCGIPFMLYVTKVRSFGMISITGIILAILFTVMGSGLLVASFCVVCGFLADIIMKIGKYQSMKYTITGYAVFSILTMGFFSRLFFMRNEFFMTIEKGYGKEYADALAALTPNWMYPVLVLSCLIGGILGAMLGKIVLKKHFKKAGIA